MQLLIKNGILINAGGRMAADIAVDGGRIAAVRDRQCPPAAGTACADEACFDEVVDASGLFVLPGAIDAHTHFELPYQQSRGSGTSADDFFTGTRSAACGGVTTVIDFVTPEPGESLAAALGKRQAQAAPKACIDYCFHMSLTKLSDCILEEMSSVAADGICSFKVYMTYEFRVTDDEFFRALSRTSELGALIMVHAEDHETLTLQRNTFIAQNTLDPWHHYLSRPEAAESKAVERAIELARKAGAALYIVHLACADGVTAVSRAQRGSGAGGARFQIYAETCPQYLHFTNDVYKRPDGHNFVCSPPVKGQSSRDALWQGIADGTISVAATDHCPFMLAEKAQGKADFTKIPNGVMGTEVLYPYILGCANAGRISFERAVGLCAANPARIFGLSHKKGTLAPGMDADIVLYDPRKEVTISQENSHSAADYTIWEGLQLKGFPVCTYSRGRLVFKDGSFMGARGTGEYVKRYR